MDLHPADFIDTRTPEPEPEPTPATPATPEPEPETPLHPSELDTLDLDNPDPTS